jgi:hypothetical protein
MTFKEQIDSVLSSDPNYISGLSKLIQADSTPENDLLLSFFFEYLPFSISEELLLFNHIFFLSFTQERWKSIVGKMAYNPLYGKETLERFFLFHTSMKTEDLVQLGIKSNFDIEPSDPISGLFNVLKNDNPRILKKYISLGLTEKSIKQLHAYRV